MTRNEYWAGLTRAQVRALRFSYRSILFGRKGVSLIKYCLLCRTLGWPLDVQYEKRCIARGMTTLAGPRGRLPG